MLVKREESQMQKSNLNSLNICVATINKIINQDLKLKKDKNIMYTSFCQGMWFNAELGMKTISKK